jgi:hypothetical protein
MKEKQKRKKKKHFIHSRNRTIFYKSLSDWEKSHRQNRIPRIALLPPSKSAWRKIFASRNDQALITLNGFDYDTFECLHEKFKPYFDQYSPFIDKDRCIKKLKCPKEGRKWMITSRDCLALNLAWTRTRRSTFVLQIIFGMTETPVSMYLKFGRRLLIHILKNESDCNKNANCRRNGTIQGSCKRKTSYAGWCLVFNGWFEVAIGMFRR